MSRRPTGQEAAVRLLSIKVVACITVDPTTLEMGYAPYPDGSKVPLGFIMYHKDSKPPLGLYKTKSEAVRVGYDWLRDNAKLVYKTTGSN